MKSTGFNSLKSWGVTLACSAMLFLVHIPFKVAAMLYVSFPDRYLTDRPNAVLFILVLTTLRCIGGPLTGYLGQIFTLRSLTVVGCFIASLGVGICYVAEDIIFVTVALGLVFGLGCTLSGTLFPQILKQHFTKNLSFAVGISYVGGSIGGFALFPTFEKLLVTYGVSGALLITSAIMLNAVPLAMLMWDPKYKKEKIPTEAINKISLKEPSSKLENHAIEPYELVTFLPIEASTSTNKVDVNNCSNVRRENDDMILKEPSKRHGVCAIESSKVNKLLSIASSISDNKQMKKKSAKYINEISIVDKGDDLNRVRYSALSQELVQESVKQKSCGDTSDGKYIDSKQTSSSTSKRETTINCKKQNKQARALKSFFVFKDPVFLVIMLCHSTQIYIMVFVLTIVTDISRDRDIAHSHEIFLLMGISLSETVGFTCLGWITDKRYLSVANYMAICYSFMGLTCFLFAIATNFLVLMIASFVLGLSFSASSSASPSLVYAFIDEELHTMAIASRSVLYVPFSFTMGPLIGYFRGTLGSYEGALYLLTLFSVACAVLQVFLPCIKRLTRRKLCM